MEARVVADVLLIAVQGAASASAARTVAWVEGGEVGCRWRMHAWCRDIDAKPLRVELDADVEVQRSM